MTLGEAGALDFGLLSLLFTLVVTGELVCFLDAGTCLLARTDESGEVEGGEAVDLDGGGVVGAGVFVLVFGVTLVDLVLFALERYFV